MVHFCQQNKLIVWSNLDIADRIEIKMGTNSVERAGCNPFIDIALRHEVIQHCNSKEAAVKMADLHTQWVEN